MDFCTYSPDDVDVLIGGFYKVEGLSEGTFINVKKDLVTNTTTRSSDGMVARKKVVDSTYTIEITTLGASPASDVFDRLLKLDNLTGLGKFPFLVRDSNGSGYFFSPSVWVEDVPALQYGGTGRNDITWVLRAHEGIITVGGNDKKGSIEKIADLALSGLPYVQKVLNRLGV